VAQALVACWVENPLDPSHEPSLQNHQRRHCLNPEYSRYARADCCRDSQSAPRALPAASPRSLMGNAETKAPPSEPGSVTSDRGAAGWASAIRDRRKGERRSVCHFHFVSSSLRFCLTQPVHPHLFRHQMLTYLTAQGLTDAQIHGALQGFLAGLTATQKTEPIRKD
jgi:hypothetical protein